MKLKDEHLEQLEKEVQRIFDSGVNEIRVYEMIVAFAENIGDDLFESSKIMTAVYKINNDLEESLLWNHLQSTNPISLKVTPALDHLKDNKQYKALRKSKRDAESNLYDFINKNR